MSTLLVIMIIDLERPLEKVMKKGDYIVIKCHNTPAVTDSGSYDINFPYHGRGTHKEWLI